jgi:hypothetical protein
VRRGFATTGDEKATGEQAGAPKSNGHADASGTWAQNDFEDKVDDALLRLHIQAEAKRRFEEERAGPAPGFDAGLLSEIVARTPEPPYRIHGLVPSDGGLLVVAQRKTGKTTLELNIARSLITAEAFLGRFSVVPVTGRVAILNFEVSAGQIGRWAHEAGVPEDRLFLVNLRGRRNPLALDEDRELLAAKLREQEIESLIVDPFGSAFTGSSQNDPGEVRRWLDELDRYARADCGVRDLIVTAHAGWNGERVRGASALEDWADSVITMTKSDDGSRYLRAIGRDVSLDEDRLQFDPETRLLTMTGIGNRLVAARNAKARELVPHVVACVEKNPAMSQAGVEKAMQARRGGVGTSFQSQDVRNALVLAEQEGLIRIDRPLEGSRGRATKHYLMDLVQPESGPTSSGRGSQ